MASNMQAFMRRWLTMLAQSHDGLLTVPGLGNSLGVSHPALQHHLDVLASIQLVSRLLPCFRNIGKRLIRLAAVSLRDAMADLQATSGWFVDQADGIDAVGDRIARAGFGAVLHGYP